MRFPDSIIKEQLGFDFVREHIDTVTPMGKELKDDLKPFGLRRRADLLLEYERMAIVMDKIVENEPYCDDLTHQLSRLKDIRATIKKAGKGGILDEVELFEIKYFARTILDLIKIYTTKEVGLDNIKFESLAELFKILDPEDSEIMTFYVYDAYSEKLAEIRARKKNKEENIMRQQKQEDISLLLEERGKIVAEEEQEEYEIRKILSAQVQDFVKSCEINIRSSGNLDFLLAKCKLAKHFHCVKPEINDSNEVILVEAENPKVKSFLNKKNKEFTPITASMKQGVTMLTGANMGGKSITIKTITLNVYLCQVGLYTFAKKASVPLFDFICYVSDDMQSVERGLSTFGAEMINLKMMLQYVNATKGFLALDEFARGTNPVEGKSIVAGVCEYLSERDSVALISTHYDGINVEKVKRYQVIGLKNVDFNSLKYSIDLNQKNSIDILQKFMDYRLEEVTETVVPKDALNIATLLGLSADIMEKFRKYYNQQNTSS